MSDTKEKKYDSPYPSWNVKEFSEEITKIVERFEDETGFKVKSIDVERTSKSADHNGAIFKYEQIKAIPLVIIESA